MQNFASIQEMNNKLKENIMKNISFKIADTKDLLLQSYQLVYKRYIDVGFCKKNANQIYFGFHDLLIDTRTFVAEYNGKVIATLSVIMDNSASLPSDHIFNNEVNNIRESQRKIAEISRFAVSQDYKKYSVMIFQYLFQLLYHSYVISSNVTDCIIMVEPRHCKVYKKFGFHEISDIKLDNDADNAESKLMRLKLKENGRLIQYPCFATALSELKGFLPVLNESLVKHQEINSMYKKFLTEDKNLTEQEYKLFNFRGFLMNSYLYKIKNELHQKSINENSYNYFKLFNKLLDHWPHNFLNESKAQLVQLMNSCIYIADEMSLSHVS